MGATGTCNAVLMTGATEGISEVGMGGANDGGMAGAGAAGSRSVISCFRMSAYQLRRWTSMMMSGLRTVIHRVGDMEQYIQFGV